MKNRNGSVLIFMYGQATQKQPEWNEIPTLGGFHASDCGEVRNPRGKILRQRSASNGAKQISVGKQTLLVHNVVAAAFLGAKPHGHIVKWRNRDKTDNRPRNLYYALPGETERGPVGLRCSKGHPLTDAEMWGTGHRICQDCLDGKPRIRVLPDVI